jgi:hypothetical protein
VKISDLPSDSVEDLAEPPENPIVAWLKKKDIKTWGTIISECKKQVDSKKGEGKDETDKKFEIRDKNGLKEESECKELADLKNGERKDDTDQKIEADRNDKKDIKEETDVHVRCNNNPDYVIIY